MNNIARIQQALVQKDLDAILITNEKDQRYATGFAFTDGLVLVAREKAWLLTDSRYIEAAEKIAGDCCAVQMFGRQHSQKDLLLAALAEGKAERLAAQDEQLNHARWAAFEKIVGRPLLPAGSLMMSLRASKSQEEIDSMIRAQRISEKALEEVLRIIKPGMTEKEVMAELVYHMLKNGSEGNSFDPIVVTGAKTSMPHGVPGDEIIRDGDFVTMDFGSLCNGYCSDMTRTVAVGHATEEMRKIYGIVLEAQLAGIAAARSGIPGKVIDQAARDVIERAGYGEYFGHGFGHSLGLDIHEPPMAGPRGEAPMEVNDLCSAEPGIYIPGKFGVRIEDVMIIRPEGAEVITKAPKMELIVLNNG
ncbi:MAG: aminopeptidase P family protein [Oscillospiraceae bacterium]|nr:aminopeptidase P family protein [Oscillospiraceae bacterium]